MAVIKEPMGEVGTQFLFENERVKVWNLVLEPGEASPWHHHNTEYVIVVTEPGSLRVEREDGTAEEREYRQGEIIYRPKHLVHRAINIGKARYCNAIIELKE